MSRYWNRAAGLTCCWRPQRWSRWPSQSLSSERQWCLHNWTLTNTENRTTSRSQTHASALITNTTRRDITLRCRSGNTCISVIRVFVYYTCFSFTRSDAGSVASICSYLMLALNYLLHVIAYIDESVRRRNQWQWKKMSLSWQLN